MHDKKPHIDRDKCIGCTLCTQICPNTFRVNDEDGLAEIVDPDGDNEEKIQEAMDSCPVSCLTWKE